MWGPLKTNPQKTQPRAIVSGFLLGKQVILTDRWRTCIDLVPHKQKGIPIKVLFEHHMGLPQNRGNQQHGSLYCWFPLNANQAWHSRKPTHPAVFYIMFMCVSSFFVYLYMCLLFFLIVVCLCMCYSLFMFFAYCFFFIFYTFAFPFFFGGGSMSSCRASDSLDAMLCFAEDSDSDSTAPSESSAHQMQSDSIPKVSLWVSVLSWSVGKLQIC